MTEIIYYFACSLDGFIATEAGGVDWLDLYNNESEDHGFTEFYQTINGLLLGSHTYEFALSHGQWFSADKPSWVFTHRELPKLQPSISFTSKSPSDFIDTLHDSNLQTLWLMGGGQLAASFQKNSLISRYIITVVPTLLGKGIRLFVETPNQELLELVETKNFKNGFVQLTYRKNKVLSP